MNSNPLDAARLRMSTEALEPRLRMASGAALAALGFGLLGSQLDFDEPPLVDLRVRQLAQRRSLNGARAALKPLYPIGLPGGYITIAYLTARRLRRRNRRGSRAILSAAWLGWIVHRAVKLVYSRERPVRPGHRYRTDSYPSGHTTGATALAVATALVLQRDGLVSRKQAAAIVLGSAIVMGSYRVIADDHWATDVLGGWLLGTTIGLACYAALGKSHRRAPRVVHSKALIREMESTSKRSRRLGR